VIQILREIRKSELYRSDVSSCLWDAYLKWCVRLYVRHVSEVLREIRESELYRSDVSSYLWDDIWSYAPRSFVEAGFRPLCPLLFILYHYLEQNLHFGLVPEPPQVLSARSFLVAGFDTLNMPRSFSWGVGLCVRHVSGVLCDVRESELYRSDVSSYLRDTLEQVYHSVPICTRLGACLWMNVFVYMQLALGFLREIRMNSHIEIHERAVRIYIIYSNLASVDMI